jgi:DNA polymerase III epsilon subunit family exonuclease
LAEVVAVDIETTGFGKSDRILEIGAVVFDTTRMTVVSEIETIINPLRNIPENTSDVHGLTSEQVSLAPTFEEIAPSIASMFENRKLIFHNASFDVRLLNQEFQRLGLSPEFKDVDCTYKISGQSLPVAAAQVEYEFQHHSALEDARAALAVWVSSVMNLDHATLWLDSLEVAADFRTLTRSQLGSLGVEMNSKGLANLELRLPTVGSEQAYVGLLDSYLRDFSIDNIEALGLEEFAETSKISPARVIALHEIYLAEVENAARRDGIVTEAESAFFRRMALALGLDRELPPTNSKSELPAQGSLICVTGTATVDGERFTKDAIQKLIESKGYVFTDQMSKKLGIALLVQDAPGSQSSKITKAQAWGIPRMVLEDFVRCVRG